MITVSQFKDIINNKMGGKPVSKISNFYSLLYETMTRVKSHVDLPSSLRTQQLTNPIYTDVSYYVVPADLGLMAISNLRPILPDNSYYDFRHFSQRQFTIEQKFIGDGTYVKRYAIKYQNAVPYIQIAGGGTVPAVINDCESLTANGTWGVSGVATDISIDSQQVYAGTNSIEFTVNAGGNQGIVNSTMAQVDLTEYDDVYFAVYIPSLTGLTGIKLNIGQSAGQYWSQTVTSDFYGNALSVGWNLINMQKSAFTAGVGSPVWTGIDYLEPLVVGTFVSSIAGFHFDNIVANTGALVEFDYYSDYSFADSAFAFKLIPTADTDYITLDNGELPLFINQFIEIAAVDLKQAGATVDYSAYGGKVLQNMYEQFRVDFPSQRQLMVTQYSNRPRFDIPDTGDGGWYNR